MTVDSLLEDHLDDRNKIVDDWISFLGNLPKEWESYAPPRTPDFELISSFSASIMF